MTAPLPQLLVDLLSTPRPDRHTWSAICCLLDAADVGLVDLAAVKRALAAWPKELPRPAMKEWVRYAEGRAATMQVDPRLEKWRQQLLALCHDTRENEAHYNLYETAIGTSPLLRLRDGIQAATVWRQQRGEVTLSTGQRLVMGGNQSGLADLGVLMVIEWEKPLPRVTLPPLADRRGYTIVGDEAVIVVSPAPLCRVQIYAEVEVKTDGNLPPSCNEYVGVSTRQLTTTEQEQVQRQKAQTARGGGYFFAERCDEAVAALARYRDEVIRRIS